MKNIEIERKFLVEYLPNLENTQKYYIRQAYICTNPVLRIRQKNDKYFFTFKGKGDIQRKEIEEEITKEEFNNLLKKTEGQVITKTRYIIPIHNNLKAELDIYEDNLKGFKNVEVEFENIEDAYNFIPPKWFGKDITKDIKYTNAYLSKICNNNF